MAVQCLISCFQWKYLNSFGTICDVIILRWFINHILYKKCKKSGSSLDNFWFLVRTEFCCYFMLSNSLEFCEFCFHFFCPILNIVKCSSFVDNLSISLLENNLFTLSFTHFHIRCHKEKYPKWYNQRNREKCNFNPFPGFFKHLRQLFRMTSDLDCNPSLEFRFGHIEKIKNGGFCNF